MKKILLLSLVLLSFSCVKPSAEVYDKQEVKNCNYDCECDSDCNWAITIKNGFFYPQDDVLRCIFDRCGSKGGYWFEAAARYNFWKGLNAELSGSYFGKEGKALYSNDCVKVKIPTVGLGLKYFFRDLDFCSKCDENRVSFFLGAGLRVFFYKETNNYPYVINCIKKTSVGGMINAGIEFKLYKGLFLDLFADYNFKELCLDNKDLCNACGAKPSCTFKLKIGGLVTGVGLGYRF